MEKIKAEAVATEATDEEVDRYFADVWKKKAKIKLVNGEFMGLDMFIYRRDRDKKVLPDKLDIELDNYEESFMYWRKANHIHLWMVNNIQNKVDDCNEYQISPENLIFFYDELVKARLSRDKTIFPPSEGFFFGSTSIDEYYWETIRDTIEKLKSEVDKLKKLRNENRLDERKYTYFYRASW